MTMLQSENFGQAPREGIAPPVSPPILPAWVDRFVGASQVQIKAFDSGEITQRCGDDASLISVRIDRAIELSPHELESRTIAAYRAIRAAIEVSKHAWPVRVWNFLPRIHEPLDEGRDRYMVFNAGRFKACCDWWGGRDAMRRKIPTATGVGHRGGDLAIHCLAIAESGSAVENPRQIPAFEYSEHYGPLPPCFTRATRIVHRGQSRLLVGGTASIVGERSLHIGCLETQTRETFANLASLLGHATGAALTAESAIAMFESLRVYHPRIEDRDTIARVLASVRRDTSRVEFVRADLCRSELLVEIEGVAELD